MFAEVIRIWTNFTCLRVLEIIFQNPETSKIQTKIMRARPDAYKFKANLILKVIPNWHYSSIFAMKSIQEFWRSKILMTILVSDTN